MQDCSCRMEWKGMRWHSIVFARCHGALPDLTILLHYAHLSAQRGGGGYRPRSSHLLLASSCFQTCQTRQRCLVTTCDRRPSFVSCPRHELLIPRPVSSIDSVHPSCMFSTESDVGENRSSDLIESHMPLSTHPSVQPSRILTIPRV